MSSRFYLLLSFILHPFMGFTQQLTGLQFSNFNGVHAIYTNPAGIADARFKKHSNIVTTAVLFANDYASLELPFSFKQMVFGTVPDNYKNTKGNIDWQGSWIKENLNGKPKNLYVGIENRGPAYMNRLGKNGAFAVASRTRGSLQLNQVAEPLVQFGKGIIEKQNAITQITDSRFTMNVNAYQELSFSLAHVLYNKKSHYAKAGATGKYLMGLGSGYIVNNGFQINTLGGDSLMISQSDVSAGFTQGSVFNRFTQGIYQWALPSFSEILGGGFGWDAGFIYEHRPNKIRLLTSKNRYLWKLSISLLDMGSITYGKNGKTFRIMNQNPVKLHIDSGFGKAFASSIDSGIQCVRTFARNNMNYQEGSGKITASIPSTLNVQFDWNVLKWIYVGVNWSQAVVSRRDIALRRPSSLIVIPRIENKWIECSMPLCLYNDYKNVGLGWFTRIGPVFFGTDNLLKSINSNSYNGLDFYLGISTGIRSKKSRRKN
ncbi:MAG: DUF5723 family protein [Sphingomonadales bacterium]